MHIENPRVLIGLALAVFAAPALADDCTAAKSAMLNTGHTPHSLVTTTTDGRGKKSVTRQVQTVGNKYVQTANGKWYAMNIAIKDLNNDLSGVIMCRRSGSESVSGESAAVYDVHLNLAGETRENRMWVSARNLILKSEYVIEGTHYTTEYDFAHVTAPANAVSMGGK